MANERKTLAEQLRDLQKHSAASKNSKGPDSTSRVPSQSLSTVPAASPPSTKLQNLHVDASQYPRERLLTEYYRLARLIDECRAEIDRTNFELDRLILQNKRAEERLNGVEARENRLDKREVWIRDESNKLDEKSKQLEQANEAETKVRDQLHEERTRLDKERNEFHQLQSAVEIRERELAIAIDRHKVDLDRLHEADELERINRELALQLQIKEEDLLQREKSLVTKTEMVERAQAEIDGARADLDEHRKQLRKSKKQCREALVELEASRDLTKKLDRKAEKLQVELEDLQTSVSLTPELAIKNWETVEWLLRGAEVNATAFSETIAFSGEGPWYADNLQRLLASIGFKTGKCGAKKSAETIIVGRHNFDPASIEAHINARENNSIYIFPQELFIASLLAGRNPFDEQMDDQTRNVLELFGSNHQAIQWLLSLQFPWPQVEPTNDSGDYEFEKVEESPLIKLGYRAGVTIGLSDRERWQKLEQAFEGKLPFVESKEYMRKWHEPGSRLRLRRIAIHLTMLVRQHSAMRNHEIAVKEWRRDLDRLKKRYYTPIMRFTWP